MVNITIPLLIGWLILVINSSSIDRTSRTALFISIPLIGHLNPLLRQAIELNQRYPKNYDIYIVSCSNVKTHVEQSCLNTTVQFLDIGQCQNGTEIEEAFRQISLQSNSPSSKFAVIKLILEKIYPQMYEQMLKTIQSEMFAQQERVIAIVDLLTYAGADFADRFNIPYIVNNADLLPYLGWHDVLPADYNPAAFRHPPESIRSIDTNRPMRTMLPIVRYLLTVYIYFQFDRPLNDLRQRRFHFKNSVHLFSRYYSHMILVNSVFGIEYAQHLPPYVQCTGPMLSIKVPSNYYITQLSEQDRLWIESDVRPIIYVNFGTVVSLSKELITKLFLALISLEQYRVAWKLDKRDLLPRELPATFRVVPWISSTLGYLAHPNVQLYISHCGINSAYESIWLGTPILCLPFLGDQHDMAQRLVDAGVGRWLDNLKSTSEELRANITIMFSEEEYSSRQENIQRIQTIIRIHGGVERAVDLIEMATEYGIEFLVPANNSHPWYAYYNVDVYAFWLFVCLLLRQLIIYCYCCRRRHRTLLTEVSTKMKTT